MTEIPKEEQPLSLKRQRFLNEYVKDLNGKAAAIRAGYAETGAHVTACKILKDPRCKAFLKDVMDNAKYDTSLVVAELFKTALGEPDGKVLKSADKNQAGNIILRLSGQMKDKTEISGTFTPVLNIFRKDAE